MKHTDSDSISSVAFLAAHNAIYVENRDLMKMLTNYNEEFWREFLKQLKALPLVYVVGVAVVVGARILTWHTDKKKGPNVRHA